MNEVEKTRKKKKPARVQIDASILDENDKPQQAGSVFNIWYYNWGAKDNYQTKSPYRVNIKNDSGYTKADKIPNSFICLFFARGCCHKGKNCEYLHRLPKLTKDNFPMTCDCFGRDKFSDYRDDMGGVGNFLKHNRTIYIGKLPSDIDNIEELLNVNFSEFGRIERSRVLIQKNCAFITFENEWNAQFAKEAMAHQSIVGDEVLNLRWANDDPDPKAKIRNQKELQNQAINTIKQLLSDNKNIEESKNKIKPPKRVTEPPKRKSIEKNGVPEQKKQKIIPRSPKLISGYGSDSSDEED